MKRSLILAIAASASLLCAGAARANDVRWSVGIQLPSIGSVISNGPFIPLPPLPVFYPERVRYAPPPVIYEAPPVVYRSPGVVYRAPQPFYDQRSYDGRRDVIFHGRGDWRGDRHDDWRGARRDDRRDDRHDDRGGRDDRGGHRQHHD